MGNNNVLAAEAEAGAKAVADSMCTYVQKNEEVRRCVTRFI